MPDSHPLPPEIAALRERVFAASYYPDEESIYGKMGAAQQYARWLETAITALVRDGEAERARRTFLSYQTRFLGWGVQPDMRTPCVSVYVEGDEPYREVQAANVEHDGTPEGRAAAEIAAIDFAMRFVAARDASPTDSPVARQ